MKTLLTSVSVFAAMAGGAMAGGLDRTLQPIGVLFEEGGETGSYFELSFAHTTPSITGTGLGIEALGLARGTDYDNVGGDFWNIGTALKMDFNDKLSGALIFNQPYGVDIDYGGSASTTELGGTLAFAETNSIVGVLRYKFTDRWSAHGGIRVESVEGNVKLSGLAYGPSQEQIDASSGLVRSANGYTIDLDQDTGVGYIVGAAYEIPDIALRVALTYNSKVRHEMKSTEAGPNLLGGGTGAEVRPYDGDSTTNIDTPQSVRLDFQSGVAADTLVFGSVRWANWSEFKIDPKNFTNLVGQGLVDLEDTTTYELGVGRRFNEQWAGSISAIYEGETDKLVSPLAPTNGLYALRVAGTYKMGDIKISAGARYSWLGDANPETGTPDVARADFSDNTALTVGMRIGYDF